MKNLKKAWRITIICLIALHCVFSGQAHAQWGIGIKIPGAKMHVHNGTILSVTPKFPPETSPFYAPLLNDDDEVIHAFKWIHAKSAIRFLGKGFYNIGLDTLNAGRFSSATGYDSYASGLGSSSFGLRARTTAFGSFAAGRALTAGGNLSFAQGDFTVADGPNTISMGTNLSNNYQSGSFIFGHANGSAQNTSDNQFKALFGGGYELYSNAALTIGMILSPGNNAWTVVSDVRKKENFLPVQGNRFLKSISKMPLTSWNYKGQTPNVSRHYGPMAQDFFKAFGTDAHGTIGTDTTINQADLDGVILVAIQELVKISDELEKENDDIATEVAMLRLKLSANKGRKAKISVGITVAKR
ncbi:tail fiber domain-containing protein [Dyadobacter endophyticus]|uniref:tail fiber domain-containing protein n=1 Tax=Dyadobacter endophyticus TaxID=1749036 RepID=UPI003CEAB4A2